MYNQNKICRKPVMEGMNNSEATLYKSSIDNHNASNKDEKLRKNMTNIDKAPTSDLASIS